MRSAIKISRFTMIELALSFSILAMIAASFFLVLNKLDSVNSQYERELAAITVLDNFMERVSAEKNNKFKRIESLFNDEFNASPLTKDSSVSHVATYKDSESEFCIFDSNQKPIIKIKIKCEK